MKFYFKKLGISITPFIRLFFGINWLESYDIWSKPNTNFSTKSMIWFSILFPIFFLLRTGELQSSSNQFMKVDGFALVFSSSKEIDDFVNAISPEKITEFLNKPKNDALFKD